MSFEVINENQLREMARAAKGKIDRIYLHWTAGTYDAPSNGYHINIAGPGGKYHDGELVVPGKDLETLRAHTWKRNSGAIGISVMCCEDATGEHNLGPYPPTEVQLQSMARAAAIIADELGIEINYKTVMTHAEAAANRDKPSHPHENYGPLMWGSEQCERWDLLVLRQGETPGSGGDSMRQMAQQELEQIRSLRAAQPSNAEFRPAREPWNERKVDNAYPQWGGDKGNPVSTGCIEVLQRLQAIQKVEPRPNIAGLDKLLINEIREYGIQAKAIIDREGHWPGQSADMEIAKKMAGMGYPEIHVRMALMNASPETADKTTEQVKQYGQEIYAQVITPELQQSLSHRGHGR